MVKSLDMRWISIAVNGLKNSTKQLRKAFPMTVRYILIHSHKPFIYATSCVEVRNNRNGLKECTSFI